MTVELRKNPIFELQYSFFNCTYILLPCFFFIAVLSHHAGVEQLSSLQHLDLAYNLLLEHSQLAPLSLLHCLNNVRKHRERKREI